MRFSFPGQRFVALCACLLCLSGCGGSDDSATADMPSPASSDEGQPASPPEAGGSRVPELDPCSLVSKAEIEKIVGEAVDELEPSSMPSGNMTYYSCRSDGVHIDVEAWASAGDAESLFGMGTQYPPVEDMGHPARNTQPLGEIDVLVGQFVVTVDLFTNQDPEAQLESAKQIARLAMDRLP